MEEEKFKSKDEIRMGLLVDSLKDFRANYLVAEINKIKAEIAMKNFTSLGLETTTEIDDLEKKGISIPADKEPTPKTEEVK